MDRFNWIAAIIIGGLFALIIFSVIAWLVCMLIDRENVARRKKYATLCLIAMLALVAIGIASFIINFKRNTM